MAKLKTGRHTGAIKAERQSRRRSLRNRTVRKDIRRSAREFLAAVQKKDEPAARELLSRVSSVWDKAAKTGVIHWKAAARKKSRLAGKIRALAAG